MPALLRSLPDERVAVVDVIQAAPLSFLIALCTQGVRPDRP
jgi:hypothetical protein